MQHQLNQLDLHVPNILCFIFKLAITKSACIGSSQVVTKHCKLYWYAHNCIDSRPLVWGFLISAFHNSEPYHKQGCNTGIVNLMQYYTNLGANHVISAYISQQFSVFIPWHINTKFCSKLVVGIQNGKDYENVSPTLTIH